MGVGKSRFTVLSMQNTEFILVLLFIIVLFICISLIIIIIISYPYLWFMMADNLTNNE
jgi:hypothetical protein